MGIMMISDSPSIGTEKLAKGDSFLQREELLPEQLLTSNAAGYMNYQPAKNENKFQTSSIKRVHLCWLAGMSCDACTIIISGATNLGVEAFLVNTIPGLPKVALHHPVPSTEAGKEFVHNFELTAKRKLNTTDMFIAAIAIGTCITWGGIPAAGDNPTGSMSIMDLLRADCRSALGLPVINIPIPQIHFKKFAILLGTCWIYCTICPSSFRFHALSFS
jgi:Ni,Fe-hydrogenase I small subunit